MHPQPTGEAEMRLRRVRCFRQHMGAETGMMAFQSIAIMVEQLSFTWMATRIQHRLPAHIGL
jgi:hypothetical protein